jgi:Flp pilus assembly protein TadD
MTHRIALAAVLALMPLGGCQTTVVQTTPRATDAASASLPSDRERELYLSVIGQLIEHEKFYAALAHLDEFERVHGATDGSHKLRGDAWVAVGALDNAEVEYTAIAEGRFAGFGEHGLGRVAAAREDWTSASRHFERAVGQQPTNTRFLQDFAGALYELGRMDDAEFQLRKALELSASVSPTNETLRTMLATRKRTALATSESTNAATADARNVP